MWNGQIAGVSGLDTQLGNVLGLPGSRTSAGCPFSCAKPVAASEISAPRKRHYFTGHGQSISPRPFDMPSTTSGPRFSARSAPSLQSNWDFNGIFPGSGSSGKKRGCDERPQFNLTPGAASPHRRALVAPQDPNKLLCACLTRGLIPPSPGNHSIRYQGNLDDRFQVPSPGPTLRPLNALNGRWIAATDGSES